MKWILNHLRAFVAIVAFGITFVIVGIVMLSSYVNFLLFKDARNEFASKFWISRH